MLLELGILNGVFRNVTKENGTLVRNKSIYANSIRIYSNAKTRDYDKMFTPMIGLGSIRILRAFVCHLQLRLHQIDIKSAFLNKILQDEV